jgi:hypothetical protein
MNNSQRPSQNSNRQFLYKYASLGSKILVGLGLAVFIGLKADQWLSTIPLFSILLPLIVLFGIFFRLFRDTRTNSRTDEQGTGRTIEQTNKERDKQ